MKIMSLWVKYLNSKKIAIAVAILASLFFIFYFSALKKIIRRPQAPQATPAPASEFKTVSEEEAGFPKEITIEKGAKIISTYDIEVDGSFQSVRSFISKKSVADNFSFYKVLLLKNDWQITGEYDQKEVQKSLHARKGDANINIVITNDDKSKVEITYLIPKENE